MILQEMEERMGVKGVSRVSGGDPSFGVELEFDFECFPRERG